MASIRLETFIHAPREHVFDLARDLDFHQRSLAHTEERIVSGRVSGRIELGEEVEWEARHLGLKWRLRSRITELERPFHFLDVQIHGPFRSFRHLHHFSEAEDGTRMVDEWHHVAPLGPIGALADRLFLERHMRRLLTTRNEALRRELEPDTRA